MQESQLNEVTRLCFQLTLVTVSKFQQVMGQVSLGHDVTKQR